MNSKFSLGVLLVAMVTGGCIGSKNRMAPMVFQYELSESEQLIKTNHELQAIEELEMLIQMDPHNSEALFLRGLAYQKMGKFIQATNDYQSVIRVNPKNSKATYNLAMIYAYQLNEKELALKYFDQFLSIEPYHAQSFNVAKTMMSLDNARLNSLPTNANLEDRVSEAQATTRLEDRRKKLLEGTRLVPDSPMFYYLLGKTYEQEGARDPQAFLKAVDLYRTALEHRPTSASIRVSLGQLLLKLNHKNESALQLRKAQLFDPGRRTSAALTSSRM